MKGISKTSTKKGCMTCGQEFADAPDKCPFDGTTLAALASELASGEVLGGRYEIVNSVAAGGMGQIYKAKHQLMNRMVAIKTIHLSLMSGGALKRFQQEAQAISALNHPNILSVFDFFISDDGQPYLVMDYLQGTNLRELLKTEKRVDLARALPILIEACAGFQHAHEHGVIHRDIKPANLMLVDYNGSHDFVKIVDFGIAKVIDETGESKHLTATGDTFGSPEYMSPEQCRAKIPDARSDIYSLGCVMYVMLTGTSPFKSQDPMEIMYKQVHDSAVPPSKVCPEANLPEAIDAIILKAIQKEPENRFQTMDEMRQALLAIPTDLAPQAADATADATVKTGKLPEAIESKPSTSSLNDVFPEIPIVEDTAEKGQSIAAKAAVGVAVIATIVIAFGAYKHTQSASTSPAKVVANHYAAAPASQARSSTTNQTAPPTTPPAGLMPTESTAAPTAPAVAVAAAIPAAVDNPQLQQLKLATATYQTNLKNAQAEYRAHHFAEARIYFQTAHSAAAAYGQRDARYIDTLYWISKCDLSTGQYQQAASGLQYALYAQKALYGVKSAAVRATERDLASAKKALKQ